MRLFNISFQKIKFVGLLLVCLFLIGEVVAQNKPEKQDKYIDASLLAVDADGNALPGASVVVGEGIIHAITDANGGLTFNAKPRDFVTVSLSGYEKKVMLVSDLLTDKKIVLEKAKLFMTSEDVVQLPFMTLKKRQITGSTTMLKGEQLDMYPSTDIRNALTGLANGLAVQERHAAPGLNAEEELGRYGFDEKITVGARGRRMMYIIDDIPTDITEMPLDPGEIESVSVIKDIVGKSMFGPASADGIILIKTKRGKENERILKVNLESGINMVDRFPEMVDGANYARLNNMARTNSGLDPLYSEADIAAYAKNDPYDMYHPSVDYRGMMLNNTTTFNRANISSRGGNSKVQYFAYLGYNGEGDLYKLGATADYNRINSRSNIDIKINDFIKVQFDFFGGLSIRRSPNYGYDSDFTSDGSNNSVLDLVEFSSALSDMNNVPPIAFPVYANNDPSLKAPWYAVSSNYGQNPIGRLEGNGYYTETGRTGAFNVAVDYDMASLVPGLKSRTYIGFNSFNLLRIGKAEDYTAYRINHTTTESGADTITLTNVRDGIDQSDQAKLHDFYYQRFAIYENLTYEKTFGKSNLLASATYYQSKVTLNGIEEPRRQQIGSLTAMYSYDDKYNVQGVLNYAGGSSFSEDERFILSPAIGASWVISEEDFMQDVEFLDYLKIRAEGGVLGYESFLSPFYYRDDWNYNSSGTQFGPHSANQWFGSATDNSVYRTTPSRIGNPALTWEKRREFTAGFDASMFNNKLYVEANYYNQLRDGVVSRLYNTIPYVAGISSWTPRLNYNQYSYTGVEAAIQYTNNEGDFKYSFGGNATYNKSVIEKYDEPNYRYDYQSRLGQTADGIWGLTYIGKFASDEEALAVPQLYDDELHAGDLKYEDKNNDGVVDDNDQSLIGNSSPKLYYALNARFSYKNVELSVMGTGFAFFDILMSNGYYQNGWGDDNYSAFVRDNIGGAYPKLTYYRVNNNFVYSDFWLMKGGFFKIQNVELAWNIPMNKLKWTGVRGARVFARGANLLTITKVKDVDPESTSAGVSNYPLFRTVTGGIKLTF